MGSRLQASVCKPASTFLVLALVTVTGFSALLLVALVHDVSFTRPRKLQLGATVGDLIKPGTECCIVHRASSLSQDTRGWLLDPVAAALGSRISGATNDCRSVHAGQITAGNVRANHRHQQSNETFLVWGAEAKFRVENPSALKGYTETFVKVDEVGIFGCPAGHAHALINTDSVNTLYFVACQDGPADPSNTDYNIWTDLKRSKGTTSIAG
ncbi:hypothetical protein KP509_25G041700 [Ceratopteris richardii]|uniref:Cupin type-1 domain-containing protein n=1 Tax=Ceratopteris richardii TaxID=49495 RepID=A0A8T2RQK3_CERRI|nr:hypothetical protein KP509_25G041700 [Ceratopteris richardii]